MSKTALATPDKNDELKALRFALKRQDEQSKVLQKVIEVVVETRDEVVEIQTDIKKDVQELRDSITLNRTEGAEIQSAVGKKAWNLTDQLFTTQVSDDLFLAKVGHFRGIVYKRLKETFNVPRYFDIRRIDFNKAKQVIEIVELSNLKSYQLRLTARQKEIAKINGDDISEFE